MFRIHRSPLCEYMINFIHKLKHLPEKYMMNSVLENFTILQVHRDHSKKVIVMWNNLFYNTGGEESDSDLYFSGVSSWLWLMHQLIRHEVRTLETKTDSSNSYVFSDVSTREKGVDLDD